MATPKIRFKEYTHAWEQRKLGEVVDVIDGDRGVNYPNGDDFNESGHTLFLSAANVTKDGFAFATAQYITEEKSNSLGNGKVRLNDIVLTSRGSLGHVVWYNNYFQTKVPFARINSGMLLLRAKEQTAPHFVEQYLKSPMGKKQIEMISFGSAQPQLTKRDITNYDFAFPTLPEQTAIGTFFRTLDDIITLHKRKLDGLRDLKRGYLQRMFPRAGESVPQVRFAGFEGVWKEKKLSDLIERLIGGASIEPDDYCVDGVRTIPKGAVNSSGVADLSSSKVIPLDFFEKNRNSEVKTNELVTSLRDLVPAAPNMGRIVKIYGKSESFLMPQGVYKLCLKSDADEQFLIAFSNSDKYRAIIQAEKNGSTQVHIRNGDFLNIGITAPSYPEQAAIGAFFRTLDGQIAAQAQKVEQLQRLKAGYLQGMFV